MGGESNAPQAWTDLVRAGIDALAAGDAASAKAKLEMAVDAGASDIKLWHALAAACEQLGDEPGLIAAATRAFNFDRGHIPTLMLLGDHYSKLGDERTAGPYYRTVVAFAAQRPDPSNEVAAQRARQMMNRYADKMMAHTQSRLAAAGYDKATSSERFTHAVDLLSGARQRYQPEPRAFYYPELPQIQFFPREKTPWLDAIEAATDDIAEELQAIVHDEKNFVPYIQRDPRRPVFGNPQLMDKKDWSAFFLWKDGEPIERNASRCPKTMAALSNLPLCRIKGRAPSVLFSRLLPGSRIPPHNGFLNTRLICHLPLIVPPNCGFRVGNDTRQWERGKAWAFDDTIEHEAWNLSDRERIILIFEVWRPELSQNERDFVTALIESIDEYSSEKAPWSV